MSCRWVASDQPRVVPRRHAEDCEGEPCEGCLPCTQAHCRVCGKEHAEGTCAACVGEARDDLREIDKLCTDLRGEVEHRGVDSEAMALLAPSTDPEAWGHITTSLRVGRLPVGYLGDCVSCRNPWPCERHADDERHPLFILGTWEQVWREALDHESDAQITIGDAVRYLDQQLTYMAGYEHAPFEDFARDLRRCRSHLEAVLHDGEQREAGAPCVHCGTPLLKVYRGRELPWSTRDRPALAHEDGWACTRCPYDKRWTKPEQYNLAVKAVHTSRAKWLTDADMANRVPSVRASTVRSWAREHDGFILVRKRQDAGRTVYSVADVRRVAQAKGYPVADEDTPPAEVVA